MKSPLKVILQPRRIRCEVHSCNNNAKYSLGVPGFAGTHFNVCAECLKEICSQGAAFVAKDDAILAKVNEQKELEAEAKAQEIKTEIEKEGFYTCKYCGDKFPKAEGTSKFAQHVKKCKAMQVPDELKDLIDSAESPDTTSDEE